MQAQPTASALVRGRECYALRAWADALEALTAAASEAPLEAEDVERLAWAAGLVARDDQMFSGLERAYELHLAAGREERAAYCAFWLGFRLLHLREIGRGSGWLGRAAQLVERGGRPSVIAGYLLIPVAYRHIAAGDLDAAESVANEIGAIAATFRDRDLEGFGQSLLGRVLLRQGHVERGLALFDLSVLTVSEDGIAPNVAGIVYCAAIANCTRVFALDRAREWTLALSRFCEAQPQLVTFSGTCLVHCSQIRQTSGEWPEAEREAERACERVPRPDSVDKGELAHALYQRAELKRVSGDFAAAESLYRAASEHGREPQPGLSLLRLAQGKAGAAAVAIKRVLAETSDPQERIGLLPAAVEVLLGAGQVEEARPLAAELAAAAAHYQMDVLVAMAAHAEGSVHLAENQPALALPPLRASFEIWQRMGAPYLAARVRVELGQACRALGDRDGAELERRGAQAIFEKLGARHDLVRSATPALGDDSSGLSARELEVLRLVASGKTNKTIAVELSLSEKTVDRHVSNIFVKLNVSSRAAATAYAYQHQLH